MVVKVNLFLKDELAKKILIKASARDVSIVKQILDDLSQLYGLPTEELNTWKTVDPGLDGGIPDGQIQWGQCKYHARRVEGLKSVLYCRIRRKKLDPELSACISCPKFEKRRGGVR